MRRYLGGFGPASAKDVSSFCGWSVTATRRVLQRLELRRFRDESGGELFDLPGAPLPPADTPAPVRFLGQWDAVLLVHARRAQILPEEHRPVVFATTSPQSVPTFLVDGQVAGTWRHVDGAVRCEPFHELPRAAARELQEEAEAPHAVLRVGLRVGLVRERGCPSGSHSSRAAPRAPAHGRGRQARGRRAERTDGRSRS